MTKEEIEKRISELKKQREEFILQANVEIANKVGSLDGQISVWESLLKEADK